MFATRFVRSPIRFAAVLSMLVLSASCGKDSTGPDDEPHVEKMRITFGTTSYTFSTNGSESRAVRVPLGATSVSVQWLRVDGSVEPLAVTPTFTLKVTGSKGITFTNTSAQSFTGTLNVPTAVTNAPVQFALLHVAENHEDFGPLTINISAP